jgi:hypothetical protein
MIVSGTTSMQKRLKKAPQIATHGPREINPVFRLRKKLRLNRHNWVQNTRVSWTRFEMKV